MYHMHPFINVDDARFWIYHSTFAICMWELFGYLKRSKNYIYIHLYVVFYVIDDYKLIINKVLQSIVEVFISDKYFYARHDIYDCLHRNLLVYIRTQIIVWNVTSYRKTGKTPDK